MDGHSYSIEFKDDNTIDILNNTQLFSEHLLKKGITADVDEEKDATQEVDDDQENHGEVYPCVYGSCNSPNNLFQVFVFIPKSHIIQTYGTFKDRTSNLKFTQFYTVGQGEDVLFNHLQRIAESEACKFIEYFLLIS